MKIIDEIYNKNCDIVYGWKDKKGIVHTNISDDFASNFSFQTIDEIVNNRVAICWETTELTRYECEQKSIDCQTFMFIIPYGNFFNHTIAVARYKDNYYWIENSLTNFKGVHKYNKLNDIFETIINNFDKIARKDIVKSDIKIFKYDKPDFGLDCLRFCFYCMSSEQIKI